MEYTMTVSLPDKRILCVDDEFVMRQALERVLDTYGCKTISTNNGKDAVAITELIRPDLIFLDISMPGMDGHEVVEVLKEKGLDNIPIVMLTGDRSNESILKSYGEGCMYYIIKPFMNEEIKNIVEYLLCDLSEEEKNRLEAKL